MILQCTADNFRRRCGAVIHKNNNGVGLAAVAVHGMVGLLGKGASALRNNDLTFLKEFIGGGNRLGEQAARIPTQVKNEPLEVRTKAIQSICHFAASRFLE